MKIKVGSLVNYYDGLNCDDRLGLVTGVEANIHVVTGKPAVPIIAVLWSDGERMLATANELRVLYAGR